MSAVQKNQKFLLLALRIDKEEKILKEEKKKHKLLVQWFSATLGLLFMPACLRCRTLVDTNVLPYELCCSVQGRLKTVFLCLRYVDTVALGTWFVLAWCAQRKKSRFENQNFVVVCDPPAYDNQS